jgi:NhaP-type Na+/H+ or K+/H+ antiporter
MTVAAIILLCIVLYAGGVELLARYLKRNRRRNTRRY